MKKAYITPSVEVIKMDIKSSIMVNTSPHLDESLEFGDGTELGRENNNTDDHNNEKPSIWDHSW